MGTVLALSMLASLASNAFAVSTIAPNEVVFGYQSIDFENGYTVGETVMSNPLSGGQVSKDGQLYCSVEGGGTKDSVSVTIDGDDTNRYLKITDHEASNGVYANFKVQNTNSALNDEMDYFVLKCRMKNGDSITNAVKNLNLFRTLTFNEDGNVFINNQYDTRYMPSKYDWNDYMFVADKAAGKLYVAINGEIIDSIETSDSAYSSLSSFLGLQFYTLGAKIKDGTFYMDNIELYGVKEKQHEVTCAVEKDEANSSVLYAKFSQPVKFDKTNLNTAADVKFENGRYKITVADPSASGGVIIISGVKDIYGSTLKDVYASVSSDDRKFTQIVDFEKYEVGESIINSDNVSDDGIWRVSDNPDTTYKVVKDGENKVLEIYVPAGKTAYVINALNTKAQSSDKPDYLVISYKMKNGNANGEAFPFIGLFDYALRRDEKDIYPSVVSTGSKYNLGQNVWNEYTFILDTAKEEISAFIDGKATDLKITNRGKDAGSFFKEQWTLGYSGGKNFDQRFYLDDIEMYGINTAESELTGEISVRGMNAYVSFNHPTELKAENITIDNGASVSKVDFADGSYCISFDGLEANKTYNVKVSGVVDAFGCECDDLSASFTVGKLEMKKNYLTVSKFLGYDDFESYDGLGVIRNYDNGNNTVTTITNKKTGYKIDDAWTMNSEHRAEYALVKDGDNTVLKISVPGEAFDGDCTTILQPDCEVGDYTNDVKGNVYVYSFKFKSGSETEDAFGETAIEDFVNPINLADGSVSMAGGDPTHAFEKGKWVDFKYVIDWTGENQIHYAIADGKVVGILEKNLPAIQSSTPRIAVLNAIEGAVDSAFYIDDIEVYTTHGVKGNLSVLSAAEEIKSGEGLTVEFNSPVGNITDENIEGAPADIDSITSLGANKCVINFKEALAEGSYTIKLKNVEDVYKNTLSEKEISFNVVSGGKFEGISDVMVSAKKTEDNTYKTAAVITANNTGKEISGAKAYVAAYDASGKLIGILQNDITVKMGIREYVLNGSLKGDSYKTFIWGADFKPLCKAFEN